MITKKLFVIAYALFISSMAGAQELSYQEVFFPSPDNDSGDVILCYQGYTTCGDWTKVDVETGSGWEIVTADGRSYSFYNYFKSYIVYLIYPKEDRAALQNYVQYISTGDFSKIGIMGDGRFVMPEYVSYAGKQYPVTQILSPKEDYQMNFKQISSLVISNTVTEIGSMAFHVPNESGYKSNLTSVVMGSSVKKIGERAFANQTLLTDIEVNSSVETVGKEAFSKCGLKTVDFKGSVKEMGEGVFSYCNQLETVNLNCEMDTLPKCTFLMCKNLSSVSLGNNIHVIEKYAFSGTEKLTSITLPTSLETIEVRAFGRYNFSDYCGLKKLECPSGLKSIKLNAFEGCKLEEIRFNEGLEELGLLVFDVALLKDIYCPSFIEAGNKNEGTFFLNDDSSRKPEAWNKSNWEKVHVPHDLMLKFYDAIPWSYFTIVDMETGEPFVPSENPSEKVCAKPTIDIDNGELVFSCETEDVEFVTTITCYDVGTLVHRENIKLAGTYLITTYAKRQGYKNSEIVKATLCWLSNGHNEEIGIDETVVPSRPVLISSSCGTLTVRGAEAGSMVTVYDLSGRRLSAARADGTTTSLATTLKKGDTAIVRIGEKSVKVVM